jgi:hypothetical protein
MLSPLRLHAPENVPARALIWSADPRAAKMTGNALAATTGPDELFR